MKKYMYNMIVLFLFGAVLSCNDYLEEADPNNLSSDTFWQDLNDSEANLTSVYSGMLNQFVVNTENEFFRTDLAHPGKRTNPTGAYLPWYQQRVTSDNTILGKRWDAKYQVIWRANQVIEGLNGMSEEFKSQDRWTEQMAEARFFRGLMHFYLHATFNNGSIIIRDVVPKEFSEFNKPLSTSEEVLSFFRDDLEFALENLPAQSETITRVDAGVAATILGTSYLYEGDYDTAILYFEDVIGIGNSDADYGYSLVQDASIMFTRLADFSSESIFEINYADNINPDDSGFTEDGFQNRLARRSGPNGKNKVTNETFGGQAQLIPSAWLTYEYSSEPMNLNDSRNYIDGDINGDLKAVSLRASQSIAVVNDEVSEYYGYTQPQVFAFGGTLFSLYKKYTNHDIHTTEFTSNTTPWESGRNVTVNRLADVYLMYAECLAMRNRIDEAIYYINEVRDRWALELLDINASLADGTPYTQVTLMEHLMYVERPLELSLEGFNTRYIDLRRWGVTQQRFQDLSTQVFSLGNYTYTKTNGGTANRNKSLIQQGSGPLEFTEYSEAAAAWASEDLGYFPIPQSETLNNQNVN